VRQTSLKRYKYVGKERDEETGLYYYGARYYAAWICRFVSVDPLQFDYTYYTPFQYAGNKPITFIDLDGLEPAKNPTQKGIRENKAITVVVAIALGAVKHDVDRNLFSSGSWTTEGLSIKGIKSVNKNSQGFETDTMEESAQKFNMYVDMREVFLVDESQAKNFNDYEAAIVNRLMRNFIMGNGPTNYVFPTNGVISSEFRDSDVVKEAIRRLKNGKMQYGEKVQIPFGIKELAKDTFRNLTIFNITGLVGSANITATKTDKGIHFTIFNITSLSSGDLIKNPNDEDTWSKSYVRDPEKITKYGNISQTFNLFISNEEWEKIE
jgi:RHS repeat-associated protein